MLTIKLSCSIILLDNKKFELYPTQLVLSCKT